MSGLAILRNLVSRPSGAIGLGIVLFHILIAIIGRICDRLLVGLLRLCFKSARRQL